MGKDLTETEDIKKRWQEYTEELYIKGLNDLDNHTGVVTHLECEVKWALKRIYSNLVDVTKLQLSYFRILLKDDAVKSAALNMSANLENSTVATGLERVSFPSSPKEGQCQRMFQCTIMLRMSMLACVLGWLMSKSFKLGFDSMWIESFHLYNAGFERAE